MAMANCLDRAAHSDAVRLAIGIDAPGYNVYVSGVALASMSANRSCAYSAKKAATMPDARRLGVRK